MINRIQMWLTQAEYSALIEVSLHELRTPEAQAHYLLRQALEARNNGSANWPSQTMPGPSNITDTSRR